MSPVRRAFAVLLVAAVVIAALLMLAQDQQTLQVRSGHGAEDPAHPSYLAALVGADLTAGNTFEVLTNGDQIFPAMLAAIRAAQRRIAFESYIYEADQTGEEFTRALEEAARRGVRVYMVVDSVGASGIDDEHVERLRAAGCRVARFNAPKWYSLEEVNYRTHRKILVVDGEMGFTGGVGVADHWRGNAQDEDHWRDTQIRMQGPIVRLLEAAVYENFIETDGEVVPELDPPPPAGGTPRAPALGIGPANPQEPVAPAFLVRSSPTGGSNDLKLLYLLAIASARRTLDITTPYFVTDESTTWALEDAVRRGVKVRLLVEGSITDAMPVKYASRDKYEYLLGLGIEIYEYQPTMMHTKVLIVDGVWSMFGSANFDNRSLELNDELNVAVTSRDLAARLLADMEADLKQARRLDLAAWRQRSTLQKAREKFWAAFGEIF